MDQGIFGSRPREQATAPGSSLGRLLAISMAAAALPLAVTIGVLSGAHGHASSSALAVDPNRQPSVVEKTIGAARMVSGFWSAESGSASVPPPTGPCAAIGDSLAVGSAQALDASGVRCAVSARVGARSSEILASMPQRVEAGSVILSAGVNDGGAPDTAANLRAIRARISAPSVIWLVPRRSPARGVVAEVCAEARDRAVDLAPFVGPDGIHPANLAGYRAVMDARLRSIPCFVGRG